MGVDGIIICQLGKNIFCQLLAEFNPPLIETEYVPDHSLYKDFMLIHGDQAAQGVRGELSKQDGIGGFIAVKDFMRG